MVVVLGAVYAPVMTTPTGSDVLSLQGGEGEAITLVEAVVHVAAKEGPAQVVVVKGAGLMSANRFGKLHASET